MARNPKLQQWLDSKAADIQEEAKEYAKTYNVSMERAVREVETEYIEGFYADMEALRSGDWDYGRE